MAAKAWAVRVLYRDGTTRLIGPFASRNAALNSRPGGAQVLAAHVCRTDASGVPRVLQEKVTGTGGLPQPEPEAPLTTSPVDWTSYNPPFFGPNGDLYVYGVDIGEDYEEITIVGADGEATVAKTDGNVTRWESDLIRVAWDDGTYGAVESVQLPGTEEYPVPQDLDADTVLVNSYGQVGDTGNLILSTDGATFQVPPIDKLVLMGAGGFSVDVTKTDVQNAGGTWTNSNITVPEALHSSTHITMVRFEDASGGVIGRSEVG